MQVVQLSVVQNNPENAQPCCRKNAWQVFSLSEQSDFLDISVPAEQSLYMTAMNQVPQNSDLHQSFLVCRADLIEQLSRFRPLLNSPCQQHSNPPTCCNTEVIPIPRAASSGKLPWDCEQSCSHGVKQEQRWTAAFSWGHSGRRQLRMGNILSLSLRAANKGLSSSTQCLHVPEAPRAWVMQRDCTWQKEHTNSPASTREGN